MEKRERLERTIAGEPTDRAPVGLWRPFPGDDQRTADHAQAITDFQFAYDWDVCVITPPWSFAGGDYGLQADWTGLPTGEMVAQRRPIKRSLDWTELRLPDPTRGEFGRLGASVKRVVEAMHLPATPVVVGILSPLAQAARLAGEDVLIRHLRTQPDRLRTGMNILTDATIRFIDSLRAMNLAGIYLMIHHADYEMLSESEYTAFGLPGDSAVMANLPKSAWMKMVYLHGTTPMLKMAGRVGANLLGFDDRGGEIDLSTAKTQFEGALFGGLDPDKHLRAGTPSSIRDASREAQNLMGGRRLMVGCGASCLVTTPQSHWRAARLSVEKSG